MKYDVKDNFHKMGKNLNDLKDLLNQVSEVTAYREWDAADIGVLMYKSHDDDGITFKVINKKYLALIGVENTLVPEITLRRDLLSDEMLKEMIKTTGILITVKDVGAYLISEYAMPTLMARADLRGERIMKNTLARNLYMVEGLVKSNRTIKCVMRTVEVDGLRRGKIFGCFTPKYAEVPLTALPRIAEVFMHDSVLGKGKVKYWDFKQDFTEISVEFPDAGQEFQDYYDLPEPVIPGITICSSETGASSLIVKSTARLKGQKYAVVTKELKTRHIGNLDIDGIVQDVDDQLMSDVRKLPETMEKLFLTPACPDGGTDVRRIARLIRRGIRKLGFYKILGTKRAQSLAEQLCEEINPELTYSMYDVVTTLMTVSDRIDRLPDSLRKSLAEACAKAPFIELDVKEEEDDDLVLLPA